MILGAEDFDTSGAPDEKFFRFISSINDRSMERLQRRLATISDPAGSEIRAWIDFRKFRDGTKFSQKYCMCLAYDLGVRDTEVLQNINNAVVFGIMHTFWLDNIVDNKAAGHPLYGIRNVYLTHMIFNFYCDEWRRISTTPSQESFDDFLSSEIETYSALFEEEYNHVEIARPFASKSLIAHKCSPVKAITSQIISLTGRAEVRQRLLMIVEKVSFALCVFDDLMDWEEDFERQRFTYPLQLALQRIGDANKAPQRDELKRQIFRELFCGTLYHQTMKEVIQNLDESIAMCGPVSQKFTFLLHEVRGRLLASWQGHVAFFARAALAQA